jgi:Acetoacetate decarboxylase (ADC)
VELTAVPGLPETALASELADRLPERVPPAPWRLRSDAVVWLARPGARASAGLPEAVSAARLVASGGGLVRYAETPVGAYAEAFAVGVVLLAGRPAVHVPFMAVDSEPSVVGGRANWSLPKVLAGFEPSEGVPGRARGEGWAIAARARPIGPALPFRARLPLVQEWPDGSLRRASARVRGRTRLARVSVEASGSPELGTWLRGGNRLGLLVEDAVGVLGRAD